MSLDQTSLPEIKNKIESWSIGLDITGVSCSLDPYTARVLCVRVWECGCGWVCVHVCVWLCESVCVRDRVCVWLSSLHSSVHQHSTTVLCALACSQNFTNYSSYYDHYRGVLHSRFHSNYLSLSFYTQRNMQQADSLLSYIRYHHYPLLLQCPAQFSWLRHAKPCKHVAFITACS